MLDPTINLQKMEMYCDENARGGIHAHFTCQILTRVKGVLEPNGTVEIKFKTPDVIKTMHRLDSVLSELDSQLKSDPSRKSEIQKKIAQREEELK